jgi:predicted amidophosphoribosyltransferase
MTELATCPLCRQENPPGNRFCGSCGAPLMSGEQLARRQEHRPLSRPVALGPLS